MAGNTFGQLFKITTFGESHGAMIGVVIDGCPSGLKIDEKFIQSELNRRKPGQSKITTQRKEDDVFEIVSGLFEGKTTGAPLTIIIRNKDQKPDDYKHLADSFRPSHADFTYEEKYGNRDYRGGGRSSARETAARVAAGAVAKLLLKKQGIEFSAFVSQVGKLKMKNSEKNFSNKEIESTIVRCPEKATAEKMIALIEKTRKEGDTLGGVITAVITNCPVGLGEPVFDKLHADLGKAMLSINAVKGFEYGSGFEGTEMKGSEHNDAFVPLSLRRGVRGEATATNHSGGIQGGISNGMEIRFNVAFKPVATIMQDQQSIDKKGKKVILKGKGRHDPCVVPRAVPIVEAMAALVIADHFLRNKIYR
ncbi:MAG: Chorismate synthase [Bacteroidia bacterium]|nr:Chorismate synthase [Bacteroidia bacterium]